MESKIKSTGGMGRYYWDRDEMNYLVKVLMTAKTEEQMLQLVLDLSTKREAAEMVRRLMAAVLLINKKTYGEVIDATKCGRNTISAVSKTLTRKDGFLKRAIFEVGFEVKREQQNLPLEKDPPTMADRTLYKKSMGMIGRKK